MLDIKKIIEDKVNEMVDEGAVETTIQESVEKSIQSAIKDVLGGYKFERAIEEKLQTEVDVCIGKLDFSNYKELMMAQMLKVVADLRDTEFANRLEEEFKKMFVKSEKIISMTKILEIARENFMRFEDDAYDEYFDLEIKLDDDFDTRSFQWLTVYFAKEKETRGYSSGDTYDYKIRLHKRKEDKYFKIQSLKLDEVSFDYSSQTISNVTRLDKLQCVLLNAYLNQTEIEMTEFDEDDYDTSLWDEDY